MHGSIGSEKKSGRMKNTSSCAGASYSSYQRTNSGSRKVHPQASAAPASYTQNGGGAYKALKNSIAGAKKGSITKTVLSGSNIHPKRTVIKKRESSNTGVPGTIGSSVKGGGINVTSNMKLEDLFRFSKY
jgi:hypothetical protein